MTTMASMQSGAVTKLYRIFLSEPAEDEPIQDDAQWNVLTAEPAHVSDRVAEPTEPQTRALLHQYIAAFEHADPTALEGVLRCVRDGRCRVRLRPDAGGSARNGGRICTRHGFPQVRVVNVVALRRFR